MKTNLIETNNQVAPEALSESTSRTKGAAALPATQGTRAAGLRAVSCAQDDVAAAITRNSALIAALKRATADVARP